MGEIQEVFDDIKSTIGDKGFLILMGCAVAFGLYNLLKGSEGSSGSEVVTVQSVASYPDSVTNADVIISTLQDSIEYSEYEIKEEIQGLGTELNEYLEQNFEATNDFINTGFESQEILMNQNFGEILGGIDGLEKDYSSLKSNVDTIKKQLNNKTVSTNTSTSKPKNNTSKTPNTSTQKTTSYYTYKTKKGLNTNTSIVDALKAIGVDSSMSNREKIASANGIKNYTGSYSQNVSLLSKLKQGKLIKV